MGRGEGDRNGRERKIEQDSMVLVRVKRRRKIQGARREC